MCACSCAVHSHNSQPIPRYRGPQQASLNNTVRTTRATNRNLKDKVKPYGTRHRRHTSAQQARQHGQVCNAYVERATSTLSVAARAGLGRGRLTLRRQAGVSTSLGLHASSAKWPERSPHQGPSKPRHHPAPSSTSGRPSTYQRQRMAACLHDSCYVGRGAHVVNRAAARRSRWSFCSSNLLRAGACANSQTSHGSRGAQGCCVQTVRGRDSRSPHICCHLSRPPPSSMHGRALWAFAG